MKKILQLLTLATLLATSLSAAPIHDAAESGDLAEVQRLLDGGVSVDAQDNDGRTPLHFAANLGRTEIVQLLIDRGASVDAQTNNGSTPLQRAACNNCTETAQLLIDRGASVDAQTNSGSTPLHWAARWGRTEMTQLLIDRGASVDAQNNDGETPLHWAARWGGTKWSRTETVRLLKTLPRLNEILWSAVCKGDLKTAKWALFQGASPRAIALERMFAITDNTPEDDINYLRALIERQDTLMHVAVKNQNVEMVKLLLAFGGKTNIRNKEGKTALDLVFEREGFLTILPLILEATVAEPQTEHGQALIQQLREQAEAEPKAPQFRPVYSQREDLEGFANSLGSVDFLMM